MFQSILDFLFIKPDKTHEKFGLGLAGPDPYDERDYPITAILKEDVPLPDQYIVPFYRHWFDKDFKPIPTEIAKGIKQQWGRGSCVSQTASGQKAAQENKKLSARFHHAYCKKIDGLPGEGTYLRTGQQVDVDYGISEEDKYPEPGPEMSYQEYINVDLIPADVRKNAEGHKSQSYWSVTRDFSAYMQALYQMETPIMSGSPWYESDNKTKGLWQAPSGRNVGGHAFQVIGWVRRNNQQVLVVPNSWGPYWGENGLFYIPQDLMNRLYQAWMTVDVPSDVAKIIAKYAGKNIKAEDKPDIFYVSEGEKHKYPDELVWWSNGNMFAGGFVIATQEEINLIPAGKDVEFNYKHSWGADQVKEMLSLISGDSKRAQTLYKKYFA